MFGGHIPCAGPAGPVGCRGAVFLLIVVWVMLGVAALVVWSLIRELG